MPGPFEPACYLNPSLVVIDMLRLAFTKASLDEGLLELLEQYTSDFSKLCLQSSFIAFYNVLAIKMPEESTIHRKCPGPYF